MNTVEYNRQCLLESGIDNYLKGKESGLLHQPNRDDDVLAKILSHEKWLLSGGMQNGEIFEYRGVDLDNSDLGDSFLDKSIFCGASLRNANFSGSSLKEADFTFTELSNADFSYTQLNGADLRGANLECAKFYGADISGAKLSLKDITIEQLGQCQYTPELAQMIQTKYYLMKAEILNHK